MAVFLLLWIAVGGTPASAQSDRGEITVHLSEQHGIPIQGSVTLTSLGSQFRQEFSTDADGNLRCTHLLFGRYAVEIMAQGFALYRQTVDVTSPLPVNLRVGLALATVQQTVSVTAPSTLVDPAEAGSSEAIGLASLTRELSAQPGRELLNLIQDQPGWLFEANGVLHPRGSEYETQFIINGVPRTENLSPSFAAPLPANTVESAQIRTAGFPAEYGRSLGGVVDLTTGSALSSGVHGTIATDGGSFATVGSDARLSIGSSHQQLSFTGSAYRTDRFLDPPSWKTSPTTAPAATPRSTNKHRPLPRTGSSSTCRLARCTRWFPTSACSRRMGSGRTGEATRPWAAPPGSTHSLHNCC